MRVCAFDSGPPQYVELLFLTAVRRFSLFVDIGPPLLLANACETMFLTAGSRFFLTLSAFALHDVWHMLWLAASKFKRQPLPFFHIAFA